MLIAEPGFGTAPEVMIFCCFLRGYVAVLADDGHVFGNEIAYMKKRTVPVCFLWYNKLSSCSDLNDGYGG